MNSLVVKEVNFNGDTLVAVQDNKTTKIYVGVSYVCKGLKLSKSQKDTQVQNIQNDSVLKMGCLKFQAGVFDVNNETLAIELEFLPIWLAKISITPKMQKEKPEIAQKLIEYQLKAKDVLAKAFLHKPEFPIPKTYAEALRLAADLSEENEKLKPKAESYDVFLTADNNQTMNEVAKSLKWGRNKLFDFLRRKSVLMDDNMPYQNYINKGYFKVREVTVKNGNYIFNKTQTLVTPKGVVYIEKLLKKEKDLLLEQVQ